jgi:23S rRNA (uracil1939-C5)-methyltransferase
MGASQELVLIAERAVAGGLTLGRHDGKVVLVSGAIPGERVRVSVERDAKQVIFARVVDVIEASPHRRQPSCDPSCGGLSYAHVNYEHQLTLKAAVVADAFQRLGKIALPAPVDVVPSPERGYRMRARLHVRRRAVGFFREGTHDLCDAGPSAQVTEAALVAVRALVDVWADGADACDALTVSENVAGTARVVHADLLPQAMASALAIAALRSGITGVTATGSRGSVTLAGTPHVHDGARDLCPDDVRVADEVAWRRSGPSFFQGNRFLTGRLVSQVLDAAEGGRVVDLYAGVGLFSVALASCGATVVAVESDTSAVADLEANREPWRDRLDVLDVPVEIALRRIRPGVADLVVVDPPRTGLSPEALDGVIRLSAPRVVYVSCDPPTLARDARALLAAGYGLTGIRAFDMFPNTAHIEAVCVFERSTD